MFSISFDQELMPLRRAPKKMAATIILGDFKENFVASGTYWCKEQYLKQWIEAIGLILEGRFQSCLITSMHNPSNANFINWWPMYLMGQEIIFQNQILFLAELPEPFDELNPYKYISPRRTHTEDGEVISEWHISRHDLSDFIQLSAKPFTSPSAPSHD